MLKPERKEMTSGEFLALFFMIFFIICCTLRGGYMFFSDFVNLIF